MPELESGVRQGCGSTEHGALNTSAGVGLSAADWAVGGDRGEVNATSERPEVVRLPTLGSDGPTADREPGPRLPGWSVLPSSRTNSVWG